MTQVERKIDGLCFALTDTASKEDRDYIHQQIKAFNDAMSEHHRTVRGSGPKHLDIFVRDSAGLVLGGLTSLTYWGWLEIDDLWLDEEMRGRGYGRVLLRMAEEAARERGFSRV